VINLNSLLDLSSLPVAPEFVEVLAENAVKTAVEALENLHAPAHIIQLIRDTHELGYYLEECYRSPTVLLHDRKNRFDIEEVVIETINLIAQSDGIFQGPDAATTPRQIQNERESTCPGSDCTG
jgi:hypothetical protein